MRQPLCLMLLLTVAGVVPAAAPPVVGDDAHDLILLYPKRPYRVRFHLRAGGQSFKAGWNRQVARLFAFLDADGDGKLSQAEASRAPSGEQWRQLSSGKEAIDADAAPPFAELARGKGHCTLPDLQTYYAASTAGPLQASWGWRPRTNDPLADAAWKHLDADHDGKLTRGELLAARRVLGALDRDDDDVIDSGEALGSFVFIGPTTATPGPPHGLAQGGLPFVSSVPGAPAEMVTNLLSKRYGRPVVPAIDLALEVSLDDPERPPRKLAGPGDGLRYVATARGEAFHLDDWLIDFSRTLPLARRGQARKKDAMIAFRGLDVDSNAYLDSADLYRPPFTFISWLRLADRDGDGKVTAKEFNEFWGLKDAIQGSVTFLRVESQARSLYRLLDQNDDGRLGPRELNEAWARLQPWGRGKGFLTRETLPELYRLTIGHGAAPAQPRDFDQPPPAPRAPSRGPVWFRKMDRNADGDVSLKEWLGSREQFEKLDGDRDGLISLEEALRADRRP